jgi:hypothetical protein
MYAETNHFSYILFALFAIGTAGLVYLQWRDIVQAQRAIAERDRLIAEYRERNEQIANAHRELTERNKRLAEGLGNIRDIAGAATGNIQQAIRIIAGVQSVLKTLEDDGIDRRPAGNSGGTVDGAFP